MSLKLHTAILTHSTPNGDQLIADLARVSNTSGEKKSTDAQLIGYLIRNNHWSPFQMASMCLDVTTTRPIGRQILRHLSAIGFQEFSGRYAEYGELNTELECRFQHPTNRQLSRPASDAVERETAEDWDQYIRDKAARDEADYKYWLGRGVAKEQARGILPEGLVPSRLYLHFSVRTWIHYIRERTAPGVQREHRWIALQAERILIDNYPMVAEACGFKSIDLYDRLA